MPQMMPLNWLSLMMFFLLIFMILNIFIYFNINYSNTSNFKSSLLKKIDYNWKW